MSSFLYVDKNEEVLKKMTEAGMKTEFLANSELVMDNVKYFNTIKQFWPEIIRIGKDYFFTRLFSNVASNNNQKYIFDRFFNILNARKEYIEKNIANPSLFITDGYYYGVSLRKKNDKNGKCEKNDFAITNGQLTPFLDNQRQMEKYNDGLTLKYKQLFSYIQKERNCKPLLLSLSSTFNATPIQSNFGRPRGGRSRKPKKNKRKRTRRYKK